jgi:hypothetical protein
VWKGLGIVGTSRCRRALEQACAALLGVELVSDTESERVNGRDEEDDGGLRWYLERISESQRRGARSRERLLAKHAERDRPKMGGVLACC